MVAPTKQMNELLQSCSDLTGELTAALSALLRSRAEVALAGIDRLSYGEFVGSLETPTFFNLLNVRPAGDCLMFSIEPAILYPMIDRVLGGGRDDEPPPCRPLSDIELPLAGRIVRVFLDQLARAWSDVAELELAVVQAESNPRLLRALPADEPVVLVRYRLAVGGSHGTMRLCLPCRLLDRLSTAPAAGHANDEPPAELLARGDAAGSSVELSVTLATTAITADELGSLRLGDIVATETNADSPAVVSVGAKPMFLGRPGVCQGRLAVRLSGPFEPVKADAAVEG